MLEQLMEDIWEISTEWEHHNLKIFGHLCQNTDNNSWWLWLLENKRWKMHGSKAYKDNPTRDGYKLTMMFSHKTPLFLMSSHMKYFQPFKYMHSSVITYQLGQMLLIVMMDIIKAMKSFTNIITVLIEHPKYIFCHC